MVLTCSGSASSYEWSKDGTVVSGQNASTLSFASFANTDTAAYTCVALSASGARSPVSDAVHLSPQGECVSVYCRIPLTIERVGSVCPVSL